MSHLLGSGDPEIVIAPWREVREHVALLMRTGHPDGWRVCCAALRALSCRIARRDDQPFESRHVTLAGSSCFLRLEITDSSSSLVKALASA